MSLIEDHLPASYENVPFLVPSESVERGKKTVVHEYPNSDVRYVEEFGKLQPTFSIEAIVHGEDALNQRLRLEQALERSGQGKLIHPIYGELLVNALTFRVSSAQREAGIYSFTINFARSKENVTLAPIAASVTEVTQELSDTRNALDLALEKVYNVPSTVFNNEGVVGRVTDVWESVQTNINKVTELSSAGSSVFNRVVRSALSNVSFVVNSAADLKDSAKLIIDSALNAANTVAQLGDVWDSLWEQPLFPVGSTTTAQQIELEQSKAVVAEHMRLTALACSYEAKVYTEYNTNEELTADRELLNTAYKSFLKDAVTEVSEQGIVSLAEDNDVQLAFEALRTTARKVFDEKEKTTFKVNAISPGKTSILLTAFRYYGDINRLNGIIDLNPEINVANFNSDIKALSSDT